jgi:predicted small secreted protein
LLKLVTLAAATAAALTLSGCVFNTIAGAGRDVEAAGEPVEDEAGRLVDLSTGANNPGAPVSRGPLTRACITPARRCGIGPPALPGMACECRAGGDWVRGQVY